MNILTVQELVMWRHKTDSHNIHALLHDILLSSFLFLDRIKG